MQFWYKYISTCIVEHHHCHFSCKTVPNVIMSDIDGHSTLTFVRQKFPIVLCKYFWVTYIYVKKFIFFTSNERKFNYTLDGDKIIWYFYLIISRVAKLTLTNCQLQLPTYVTHFVYFVIFLNFINLHLVTYLIKLDILVKF